MYKCYTLHLSGPLKPCIYTCYTTIHFFLLTNLEYFSFIQTNKFKDTSLLKNLKYCRAVEEHWYIVYIQTLPGTWTWQMQCIALVFVGKCSIGSEEKLYIFTSVRRKKLYIFTSQKEKLYIFTTVKRKNHILSLWI
jgi:hypothetical protein